MRAALAIAVLALAVLPGVASAATAKIVLVSACRGDLACEKFDTAPPLPIVTYVGAPGEANRLTVARAGAAVMLSDPAATITAEPPCRLLDAHTASCEPGDPAPPGVDSLSVQLGDRADAVTIAPGLGIPASLHGEDGDDVLAGGDEQDVLAGGLGADRVDGGGGRDVLSFADRADGVLVDAAAGRTSDGDAFAGVEAIQGGDGPDRLLGGPGRDQLRGGGGADRLRGAGGEDTLSGELGRDRLDGGAGDDHLRGDPPQGDDYYEPRIRLRRDVLRGGAGDDRLSDSGGANLLVGGGGDDLIFGGEGADRILGGTGADRLFGYRGPDSLRGGGGADRLSGGDGPDRLFARDGRRDRAGCGRGRDRATIDRQDRVRACETLRPRGYTSSR